MAWAFAQSGGRITTPKGIYHGSPCSACTLFGLSATPSVDSVPARTISGRGGNQIVSAAFLKRSSPVPHYLALEM